MVNSNTEIALCQVFAYFRDSRGCHSNIPDCYKVYLVLLCIPNIILEEILLWRKILTL